MGTAIDVAVRHSPSWGGVLALSFCCGCALGLGAAHAETLARQPLTAYPNARCNDGEFAAFYYSGTPSRNWVIFLDGGGSCVTRQQCNRRWVVAPANMRGGAALPLAVTRGGMFDRTRPANPVRDWNFIHVEYCSSDEWIGGGGSMSSSRAVRDQYGAPALYVFHGADIFNATVEHLRTSGIPNGVGGRSYLENEEGTIVILSGTSAGGKGTMNNAHRLETLLPNATKFYIGSVSIK